MDEAACAAEFDRQHRAGETFRPIAGLAGLDAAYAVQRHFVRLMTPRIGPPVGYKIGLTSKRMQAMCGIDQPIAGVVLESRVHRSGVVLPARNYGRIGLEFEVGMRLGRDLGPADAPFTMEKIASAVSAVCPAVEVVDDRRAEYKALEVASLVADNSWNAGVVLGEFRSSWPDLEGIAGVVRLDGGEVDRGHGRDVLGHPFAPLVWLAEHLAARGEGLREGDVVLTGSLVTTRFPAKTEAYVYELEGLGSVAVTVTV